MIEKLSEYKITSRDGSFINVECNTKIINTLVQKINELVDAVNEFEKDREEIKEWIAIVSDLRSRVPVVESRVSILEEHAHPTAKIPADPYAEQRRWIGKLCKFWDKNHEEDRIYDILHHIDPNCVFKYARRELGGGYQYCEPVKPDDDIIYKGSDNDDR